MGFLMKYHIETGGGQLPPRISSLLIKVSAARLLRSGVETILRRTQDPVSGDRGPGETRELFSPPVVLRVQSGCQAWQPSRAPHAVSLCSPSPVCRHEDACLCLPWAAVKGARSCASMPGNGVGL